MSEGALGDSIGDALLFLLVWHILSLGEVLGVLLGLLLALDRLEDALQRCLPRHA